MKQKKVNVKVIGFYESTHFWSFYIKYGFWTSSENDNYCLRTDILLRVLLKLHYSCHIFPPDLLQLCRSSRFLCYLTIPLFLLTTSSVSFRIVPVHLRVLCAPGTLGCCSKASVVNWQKVLSALWAVFLCRVTRNSLPFSPSCARTEQDFHCIDNSYHSPAWYQSASRDHDSTSYLSVLVLACCFTLSHHLYTNLCCLSTLSLGQRVTLQLSTFLSIHFLCDNSYCDHSSDYFLDCPWDRGLKTLLIILCLWWSMWHELCNPLGFTTPVDTGGCTSSHVYFFNVLNFNIIQMYFFLYINPVKVLLKSSLSIFFLNQAFQPLVHSKYSCYNHFHQEILQFFVHQIIVSLDHIQVWLVNPF